MIIICGHGDCLLEEPSQALYDRISAPIDRNSLLYIGGTRQAAEVIYIGLLIHMKNYGEGR